MKIGWVGLGKLGLPCALALQHYGGHEVVGYDVEPGRVMKRLDDPQDHGEQGLGALIAAAELPVVESVAELVAHSEVVFVAVQTPHDPAYGGETPMPANTLADFDYRYLVDAVGRIADEALFTRKHITIAVVSTVLPGTTRKHLAPYLNQYTTLVYNPFFIAMGTTIHDFLYPEFVLLGCNDPADAEPLRYIYSHLHGRDLTRPMRIESAELTKVAYNTFISAKLVFANTIMEIAHKTDADCDEVTHALADATDRVVSPAYMTGGMGDGGACHPRDNIAMSWLARELPLSTDLMGFVSRAREKQTWWLADLVEFEATRFDRRIVILGKSYKPGSPLTYGSPALLLAHFLEGHEPLQWDPYVDGGDFPFDLPHVYVIATRHPEFENLMYPDGSIVVDPFGYVRGGPGVRVLSVGRKAEVSQVGSDHP